MPGYQEDTFTTIDIGGPYLVAEKDVPDEVVYEITKVLYESMEKLSQNSNDLKATAKNREEMATPLGDLPFHPGAEKFWNEMNLLK